MKPTRLKLLLVEDNEDDYVLVRDLLEDVASKEFELTWVNTYSEAKTALQGGAYDACLLDYNLGGRTGIELLHELRDRLPVPVILLTGSEDYRTDVAATQAGASDYLVKGHINAPLLERSVRYAIQRKSSEEALLHAQRFAQATVDSLPSNIAVLDGEGQIIAVNQAWRTFADGNGFVGASSGVGENYLAVCARSKGNGGEEAAAGIRQVLQGEAPVFCLEYPCHVPCEQRWYQLSVTRFTGTGPVFVAVAHENITERKLAADELAASQASLATSQRMARLGSWECDMTSSDDWSLRSITWSDEAFRIFGYRPGVDQPGFDNFVRVLHPDDLAQLQINSAAALRDGTSYSMDHRLLRPDGSEITVHEQAEIIRDEAGVPVRLIGTVQDITERKRADDLLREQAEFQRALLENFPNGSVNVFDRDLRYVLVAGRGLEQTGLVAENLVGKTLDELYEPADVAWARGHYSRVLGGETLEFELQQGSRYYNIDATPLRDSSGEVSGVLAVALDITTRKQAENKVAASEDSYRRLFESARDGILILDAEAGLVTSANPCAAELFNRDINELMGRSLFEIGLFPNEQANQEALHRLQQSGFARYENLTIISPTAPPIEVELVSYVYEAAGGKVMQCNIREITERKQAEAALIESEMRYRDIVSTAHEGIWQIDVDGLTVYANQRMAQLVGCTREELQGRGFRDFVVDSDEADELIASSSPGVGAQLDVRMKRVDGSFVWTLCSTNPRYDGDGKYAGVLAMVTDITERRRTANERDRFFTMSLDMMGIAGLDGHFKRVNPAFLQTVGYSEAEITMIPFLDMVHPDDREGTLAAIASLSRETPIIAFENRNRTKNGAWRWFEWKAAADVDEGLIYAAARDTTDRKETEAELRRMRSDLEKRVQERTLELEQTNAALQVQIGEREQAEAETRARARQQEAVAELGRRALTGVDTRDLLQGATELVTATLDVDISTVLELMAGSDDLRIVAGSGWRAKVVGLVVPGNVKSQAGYALLHNSPTLVTDLRLEERFQPSKLLLDEGIRSGISVTVGGYVRPFGTLGAHSAHASCFTQDDIHFLQSMSNVLAAAIARTRVETEIRELNDQLHQINTELRTENAERVAALANLEQARDEAETAREAAEVANRAKSEFLSRMSHELRTPLNAISGFGQILAMRNKDADAQQQDNIQQILKAGSHLLNLINEVLDLARIESGNLSLSPEPVDAGALLKEVLDLVRPLAEARNIDLGAAPDDMSQLYVLADQQRLKQVLLNFLSNAVKYNHREGSVLVSGAVEQTDNFVVDGTSCVGRLRLAVRDSGPGLSEAQIARLFVPFERLNADRSDVEGTGIGLSLCKLLIEAMSGKIGVDSRPGEGSTFWLELPLTALPAATAETRPSAPSALLPALSAALDRPSTILYIEDNLSNVSLIQRVLSEVSQQIRLLPAMQGRLGLELAAEHLPDVILLDVNLPDIMGDVVLSRLKADPATRAIPVVVLSADATTRQIQRLMDAGAAHYLPKPLDIGRLLEALTDVLPAREGQKGVTAMEPSFFRNASFLIVDDEPQNINVLTQMLQQWEAQCIKSTTDPHNTLALFQEQKPDVVLLDLMMPGLSGFEVMELLKPYISSDDFLPIVILTADPTDQSKRRALQAGATDFLTKPFDAVELSLRLQNLLARRSLHCRLRDQNASLDQQVRERTDQLAQAEVDTVQCLAVASEYRDDDTGQHTQRVGRMAERLAVALGVDDEEAALLGQAAPLHDVGKIGIPDSILLKPDKLSDQEFAVMKTHTSIGAAIMVRHHTSLLQRAANIALTHHERWDGRGYPNQIAGDDIPLAGRVVAVVDVFDALTHERPYKRAWPAADAIAEIHKQSGSQFDPRVVDAFTDLANESSNICP